MVAANVRIYLLAAFILGALIILFNIYCGVEAKLTTKSEQNENYDKKEFKEWFKEMRDPTHKCKFNASLKVKKRNEEDKSTNKTVALINVVKCANKKGRWNYKLKVLYNSYSDNCAWLDIIIFFTHCIL